MEEKQKQNQNYGNQTNNKAVTQWNLETSKAERAVWLMKCPSVVSSCLQQQPSLGSSDPSRLVAKVVLSIDPLANDDSSSTQVLFSFFPKFFVKKWFLLHLFFSSHCMACFIQIRIFTVSILGFQFFFWAHALSIFPMFFILLHIFLNF